MPAEEVHSTIRGLPSCRNGRMFPPCLPVNQVFQLAYGILDMLPESFGIPFLNRQGESTKDGRARQSLRGLRLG